jgi:transposase
MSENEQPDTRPEKALNSRQHAFISVLATGRSITQAAQETGIPRGTVTGWMADPAFQDALAQRRETVAGEIDQSIVEVQKLALEVIRDYLASEKQAVPTYKIENAMKIVLKMGVTTTTRGQRDTKTPTPAGDRS